MGEGRWQGLRQLLKWLLIGLIHLDPMAMAAYQVSVVEVGVDEGKDQTRRRLDPARRERPLVAARPTPEPIGEADFSSQFGTRSAPASAEVI